MFDLMLQPLMWAQAQPPTSSTSNLALLALRRWCSSITLCSPDAAPSRHGLLAILAGLAVLLLVALVFQGPLLLGKQLLDVPGHIHLVRQATRRVWRASRLVTIAIGFTVVSWTAHQALTYRDDSRRMDLIALTKSRALRELALEQGFLAGITPLRDVAGLASNLPLVLCAAMLVFRGSIDRRDRDPLTASNGFTGPGSRFKSVWTSVIWASAFLTALYRAISRGAGSADLPRGGCLLIEVAIIPLLYLIVDGFLLGWILAELRNAGLDEGGDDRFDVRPAIGLMPASALACLLILPARYVATFVVLGYVHLPTSVYNGPVGEYIRWQLGWGLTDLQAAALLFAGLAGAVAWSRGSIRSALVGYWRLQAAEGGHLVIALAMACLAAGAGSAIAYAVMLLLPAQSWVLAAADSYAHFATLPVGLWLLAAFIELAERSLPVAAIARTAVPRTHADARASDDQPGRKDVLPSIGA